MQRVHFEIDHTTCYTFSEPVFLEPHVIRLRPRSDPAQRLDAFAIDVLPKPAGVNNFLDVEGNAIAKAWFEDLHGQLTITTCSKVATLRENPFDFLLDGDGGRFPVDYDKRNRKLLSSALHRPTDEASAVRDFALELQAKARAEILPFLQLLNQTIHESFELVHREHGPAWSPAETLEQRRGACRDLAVLFVDLCRAVGLAGRFVSGYHFVEETEKPDLHAWAEVYLPGAGWRGYDPTQNLAVADRHVALAASAIPECASAVSGTYRGGAQARMESRIRIHSTSSSDF